MSAFRHDSNSFGWGCLINDIKADDNVTKLKILEDFGKCTLTLVKAQASKTWHDYAATTTTPFPTDMVQSTIDPADNTKPNDKKLFFRRVCSKMIAKRIENSISTISRETLFSKRKHFTWTHTNGNTSYDGPTILQILVSSVNPSIHPGRRQRS